MAVRPVTSDEIECAFSTGLKTLEEVASTIQPIEPNEEFPELHGGSLRIRPYAVTWVYEQKDTNGRWTTLGWGKTGAVQKVSKVQGFMCPGAPRKRVNEEVPEVTLANKKSWMAPRPVTGQI